MSQLTSLHRHARIRSLLGGSVGIAELIGLGFAAFTILLVVVAYFYFLLPAQFGVTTRLAHRDGLKKKVALDREAIDVNQKTNSRVSEINASLEKFENDRLADREGGRMSLYQDLNDLIRKNALRNTSGPAYTSLEPMALKNQGQQAATVSASAANKWQSLYPGIAVNVTVEGPYQNLRHFVRDIESSRDFIIINAVELERATGSGSQVSAEEAGAPKTGNTLVSLRLDLATYFSRPPRAEDQRAPSAAATH
jgi:hypothetical protein